MKLIPNASSIARIAILALLLPAGLLAAANPDSAAISKLLQSAKAHATAADSDADTLVTYSRSGVSWLTQGNQLNLIKEDVNNLIRDSNKLASMRDEGSPWQQRAIDRITALLPEIANQLTATINYLNRNLNRASMEPYCDNVRTDYALMRNAHETIAGFADYGKAKAEMEARETPSQLSANATAP